MALIGALNFRDPRFMRMMMQEQARRPYAALPLRGNATSQWARHELGQRLAFGKLGLASKLANAEMAYKNSMLNVAGKRLDLQAKALKNEKKMLPWQIGIGGLTSFLSLLEGRRQAQELQKTAALRANLEEQQIAAQNLTNAYLRKAVGGI